MVELLKLIHCVNSMFDLNRYSYTVSIYFSALLKIAVFLLGIAFLLLSHTFRYAVVCKCYRFC